MPDPHPLDHLRALEARLDDCMRLDRPALRRRISRTRQRLKRNQPADRNLRRIAEGVDASADLRARRAAALPRVAYPEDLPIAVRAGEIRDALAEHQVLVVAGETGSGKTTQLPKICLEAGCGVSAEIACTQPRRIAATSMADRVAGELGVPLGREVGYRIRFDRQCGEETLVSFLTDGVLLAELQSDRQLLRYDAVILDEAHERSLNIDFLLGCLKTLLPKRPDLKLVVSSATLDVDRFSRYFDGAPVIEVEGRTYPVELRHHPPAEPDRELAEDVADAVDAVLAESRTGDVLAFLPTEQDIRESAELLAGRVPPKTEVLPLYGRLSAGEQRRVFHPADARRVILSTNVAETSVTVPRIRYVVDTGLARIRRFHPQTQVEHLEVEPVSRDSADQRAGRCGRVGPGVCVRLYSEDDYARRPRHTDPEIRRSSLAEVILRMKVQHLGEVETFPFLDPPERKAIRRGYAELAELGALDRDRVLTGTGRRMAQLSTEPRFARMLLEAADRGALAEALTVVAALSIRDPRERPLEKRDAADRAHRPWRDESSDFLAFLNLWNAIRKERAEAPSNNRFRAWCRKQFLAYPRVREWERVRAQLAEELHRAGARENSRPAPPETLHRALLAGLLGRIGRAEEGRDYRGAHSIRFRIFPGSGLRGRTPPWIMAAELVKTRRLYARTVAEIRPEWAEALAGPLLRRGHRGAHWEARTGHVRAYERVTLYGLPLAEDRRVDYGRIDPVEARSLFIEKALVQGDVRTRISTLEHNLEVVETVRDLEHKARRRDLLVDQDSIYDFYDRRVPVDVCNLPAFELWLHEAERTDPGVLTLAPEDILLETPRGLTESRFPSRLQTPAGSFPLTYRFRPGEEDDGVTCRLPVGLLPHVAAWRFEWLVPGLLGEKLAHLIRSLPKRLRRPLVPAPQTVEACLEAMPFGEAPLLESLAETLRTIRGVEVAPGDFRPEELPPFLRMRFAVTDEDDNVLRTGRDLVALRDELDRVAREQFDAAAKTDWERDGVTSWDVGPLPVRVELGVGGRRCYGYPALVDEGDSVALRLFEDPAEAGRAHHDGTRRLYALSPQARVRGLRRSMPIGQEAGMIIGSLGGSLETLRDDVLLKAIDQILLRDRSPVRDADAFEQRIEGLRGPLNKAIHDLAGQVDVILRDRQATAEALNHAELADDTRADIRSQLSNLVHPHFVLETPFERFADIPRFLAAVRARIERARHTPHKEARKLRQVAPLWAQCLERLDEARRTDTLSADLLRYRWMLEEYRVSVFAQEVGAGEPVSEKRLAEQWERCAPMP